MAEPVGILAAACQLPDQKRTTESLFLEEGVFLSPEVDARLGILQVPVRNGDGVSGSDMAVLAAREALQRASVNPLQVDVIVEYSILPQEYLVPVWNMSNKVQGEVGASKSFVVGFSGGSSSNFLLALSSAAALLQQNENLKTALLVTADITIPGNRVLNPSSPVSVLGDAASAVVLQRGASSSVVLDTELWSDGANHDICYIPGGSLVHPDDIGLYRLQLDQARYEAFPKTQKLREKTLALLARAGISLDDVSTVLYPNISSDDQIESQSAFGGKISPVCMTNRETHGHLQGSDFVVNYLSLMEGGIRSGDYVVAASHGMGGLVAASLIRC
jgi:3-oxoacyl-[acyl-carrier-protein] synthase-3